MIGFDDRPVFEDWHELARRRCFAACGYLALVGLLTLAICGAIAVFGSLAHADSGMLLGNVANRRMPLDGLTTPTVCVSDRRLRTAYVTNKAKRIVRASDSTTLDVGFTAAGMPDTAAETAFLAATTGKRDIYYDQCGSNNLVQATDGNRHVDTANCLGSYYCGQATAGTQTMAGGSNITPATGVMSFALVANRAVGAGQCRINLNGANQIYRSHGTLANTWQLSGGTSGTLNTASSFTDGSWYAAAGNFADSAANILVNATQANGGNTVSNTTAGAPSLTGANSTTCYFVEGIVWDNYTLTASERTFLNTNARIGWGF